MPDNYMTSKEIEAKYSVSKGIVTKWRKSGMPFYKVGGIYRYDMDEVDKWFKSQNNKD